LKIFRNTSITIRCIYFPK